MWSNSMFPVRGLRVYFDIIDHMKRIAKLECAPTWMHVNPVAARWSNLAMAAAKVPSGVNEPMCIS
jgi:hypothetical protein